MTTPAEAMKLAELVVQAAHKLEGVLVEAGTPYLKALEAVERAEGNLKPLVVAAVRGGMSSKRIAELTGLNGHKVGAWVRAANEEAGS